MTGRASGTTAIKVIFFAYAAGVCTWLTLGLVPYFAPQLIQPMVPLSRAILQYAFSALNLGLGLLLFIRRPAELVPRLLGFALLGTAATFNLPSHLAFDLIGTPLPVQLIHFSVHICSGVAYIWAAILFPAGRWPRSISMPRWASRTLAILVTALAAFISWRGSFLAHPQFFMIFFGVAVPILGVSAQTLRLSDRQLPLADRQAARLLIGALLPAFAVAVLWLGGRLLLVFGWSEAAGFCAQLQTWFPVVFALVPLVLAAGVLHYRIWEIDRLVSRVLLYSLVIVAFAGSYVLALGVAASLSGGGLWATVIALSLATALIEPFRGTARRWANRVIFGQELSPAEATRQLVAGLEQLSAGQEIEQLATVAVRATRAQRATVWLAETGADPVLVAAVGPAQATNRVLLGAAHTADPLSLAAAGPATADSVQPTDPTSLTAVRPAQPTQPADTAKPSAPGAAGASNVWERDWPIPYAGQRLGTLRLSGPADSRLTRADLGTASRIAEHAGLVLHNAELTIQLAERVSELAASTESLRQTRRRLVAAQDAERYRLERDLHDGAQQALVAALLSAAAAHTPPALDEADDLLMILRTARADIDQLVTGDQPAALAAGLGPALVTMAANSERSGLKVTLRLPAEPGSELSNLSSETATAIYFACSEALQNVAKHANATTVEISLQTAPTTFSVTDDGQGIDLCGLAEAAGGLRQLSDRLALVGGLLTIESVPDGGTRVRGTFPASTGSPAPAAKQ